MSENPPQGTPREVVEQLLLPILQEAGVELYDLEVFPASGRIAITLERLDYQGPGTGITLEDTARVTRQLRFLLETTQPLAFEWTLEVSSPGIERDLRTPTHFRKALGEQVRLTLQREIAGVRSVDGRVTNVTETEVTIARKDATEIVVPIQDVRRGRTVFDFSVYDRTSKAPTKARTKANPSAPIEGETSTPSNAGKKR
jgi:ribosome maturation factor RimP